MKTVIIKEYILPQFKGFKRIFLNLNKKSAKICDISGIFYFF